MISDESLLPAHIKKLQLLEGSHTSEKEEIPELTGFFRLLLDLNYDLFTDVGSSCLSKNWQFRHGINTHKFLRSYCYFCFHSKMFGNFQKTGESEERIC